MAVVGSAEWKCFLTKFETVGDPLYATTGERSDSLMFLSLMDEDMKARGEKISIDLTGALAEGEGVVLAVRPPLPKSSLTRLL